MYPFFFYALGYTIERILAGTRSGIKGFLLKKEQSQQVTLSQYFKNEAYDEYVENGKKKQACLRTLEGTGFMKYCVETTARFDKEFKKLDRYTQRMIKSWIDKRLVNCSDLRQHGRGLTANKSKQWRYRIGNYRLICQNNDNKLIILALSIGHRRKVYNENTHRL